MSTPSLPEWRPRKTVLDMYEELDRIPWYFRVLAKASAMILLIGFFILPLSWTERTGALFEPWAAFIGAITTVALAIIMSIVLALVRRAHLFHLNSLYLPHLTSSVLGLVNVAFYIPSRHTRLRPGTNRNMYIAISLAGCLILLYATLSIMSFRQTYIIRARDAMHRRSSSDRKAVFRPEVEEQRKQLLRLLSQQNEVRPSDPGDLTENTFKIDWPGSQLTSQRNSKTATSLQMTVEHKMRRLSTMKDNTLAESYAPAETRQSSTSRCIGEYLSPSGAHSATVSPIMQSGLFADPKTQMPLPAYVEFVHPSKRGGLQSQWDHRRTFADGKSTHSHPAEKQQYLYEDHVAQNGTARGDAKRLARRHEIELSARNKGTATPSSQPAAHLVNHISDA